MDGLSAAASIVAIVDMSAKVVSLLFQYAKEVKNASDDIACVQRQVDSLKNASESVQKLLERPDSAKLETQKLLAALCDSLTQLKRLRQRLDPGKTRKAMSRCGIRALRWPFDSKEVEEIVHDLDMNTRAISLSLQVDQMITLLDVDQKIVLGKLPAADGATFDSLAEGAAARCHPNTRIDLLRQIQEWADQPQAEHIFWLNGMAGTGKSTISRTVARTFADRRCLGASFFFKRGDGDRGKVDQFFTTIAAQLALRIPAVAVHVKAAIDADPAVIGKVMSKQFEKLILEPLSRIPAGAASTLVVVVDALDECERDDDIKLIIDLFSRARSLTSPRLKILVTSRPELPIRLGFSALHGKYQDLVLHEIPESVIEHDISAYLCSELSKVKDEYNASVSNDRRLADNWPGQSTTQILVKMAVPLFIFAATICRFLADRKCGNPDSQLKEVLAFQTRSQESKLDATYLPVLSQILVGLSIRQKEQVLARFRTIVGSIVVLVRPLSTASLARILAVSQDNIDVTLDLLHSVLSVPPSPSSPVRLLHLSFRDFLVDPEKRDKNPFWVDEQQTHKQLAIQCLRIMGEHLRTDMCGLRAPGTPRSTINPKTINDSLPPEVQYACLYWVSHVLQSKILIGNGDDVHDFLHRHFLHWLEALSLIGRASESIAIIKALQSIVNKPNIELSNFLDDAIRWTVTNNFVLDSTPLQLYSSMLAFAPQRSIVRKLFENNIPNWISLCPEPEGNWSQCLQTLEGHNDWVLSVAFSHNSALVASASIDRTVRIWRADTGKCVQELQGHSDSVQSVAFSHDSALVASASNDRTVRIWHADTGKCVQELKGHSSSILSVAFSHGSALIASASLDKTVRIWHADTGKYVRELKGHSGWVRSVAFSHDSALIASASDDRTVRIWHTDTGKYIQELQGHNDWVLSVAFSHNSALIASASLDITVRIWHADTGKCIQELQGHSEAVWSVAFSHNSALVASASNDRTVRIWRTDTGKCVQELKGHSDSVWSVAFSHDSALVASASVDKMVRIWRTGTGEYVQELKGHNSSVQSVAFSHDSALVASASLDKTVQIWHASTGKCVHELKGHSGWVQSVAFSHDSALVASASLDKTVRIWHTGTGKCIQELQGHSSWVQSVAFSHDSALVASASDDKTVRIWHTGTGKCIQELQGHSSSVLSVAFSHGLALIASASLDKTVRIWRAGPGKCVQELQGHSGCVRLVAFSHDSALVASASDDKTVRIWRTDTGECIQEVDVGCIVCRLSFEVDNSRLITDVGAISIAGSQLAKDGSGGTATTIQAGPNSDGEHRFGYGLSRDRSWVTWKGQNLLWLPVEFRPMDWVISGSTVVIGCASGRVVFIRFSTPKLP